jgi:hypothetical protein
MNATTHIEEVLCTSCKKKSINIKINVMLFFIDKALRAFCFSSSFFLLFLFLQARSGINIILEIMPLRTSIKQSLMQVNKKKKKRGSESKFMSAFDALDPFLRIHATHEKRKRNN